MSPRERSSAIFGCVAVVAVCAAFGCSSSDVGAQATAGAGASTDPCAGLVEPSATSLVPGSKHDAASGGDPDYRAALAALVRARSDVTERELAFLSQKSTAEMERDHALRDSGSYSNWRLAQLDLEKVCLEVHEQRLRLLSSAQFRATEIARLRKVASALQQEAALPTDAFRRRHADRMMRFVQEAKQPEQLLANVKARIAAATRERDALAKTGQK